MLSWRRIKYHRRNVRLLWQLFSMCLRGQRGSGGYRLVSRAWRYRMVRKWFMARSGFEQGSIFEQLIYVDEYRMDEMVLSPSDVVIDIGAHVGVFSFIAQRQGSRSVHAYEADPQNFVLLRENLRRWPGFTLHARAVVRSDIPADYRLHPSGFLGENTGGGNVIMGGRKFEFGEQEVLAPAASCEDAGIEVMPLDQILEQFERVRLLKLDCEGSEFPILLTSRQLGKVERIIGEYHELDREHMALLDPKARVDGVECYERAALEAALHRQGFAVTFYPSIRHLGLFIADRRREPGKRETPV